MLLGWGVDDPPISLLKFPVYIEPTSIDHVHKKGTGKPNVCYRPNFLKMFTNFHQIWQVAATILILNSVLKLHLAYVHILSCNVQRDRIVTK